MPKVIEDVWKVKVIKVPTDLGIMVEREAVVLGNLGFHKAVTDRPLEGVGKELWAVTHLGTSLCLIVVREEADAVKVIQALSDVTAFDHQSKNELIESLPTWVRPWLVECKKQRKFVEPASFIKRKWDTSSHAQDI